MCRNVVVEMVSGMFGTCCALDVMFFQGSNYWLVQYLEGGATAVCRFY